jgi:cardiolipin synthase
MFVVMAIINNNMNPAYKMAWIIPILLLPIFGIIFYILFGSKRLGKRARKKLRSINIETKEAIKEQDLILEESAFQNKTAARQARYIQDYAHYPPYYNTTAEYFRSGEDKFAALKQELKQAEEYIFLEYFIIEEGEMWDSILDILKEKIAQGVDVRLIYDDLGCLHTLPYKYNAKLKKLGVKTAVFNPLIPILSAKHNNRDHRKIVVIDGHTAFTGGANLADEYINKIEKYGHWKDSAIMIKGPAVWNMTVMFLSMWHHLTGSKENLDDFKYDANITNRDSSLKNKDGYIQPFTDNPLDNETVGEIVYLNLINKAQDYVYITTPYLVIDNEMVTALTSAAKAGVDVRIIVPGYADKWYVNLVTRSYCKLLIESGVRVYEYTPGFIHSKTYVCDDEYGVVGTINMDYRSLYLHFECGVWLYDCSTVGEMKEDFLTTLERCKELTREDFADEKWYTALGSSILRVFAPLL